MSTCTEHRMLNMLHRSSIFCQLAQARPHNVLHFLVYCTVWACAFRTSWVWLHFLLRYPPLYFSEAMAEAPDTVEKGLEELEEEITCPVCQEHFRDPKILPCLHYYCNECVRQLALRAGANSPFACPECRRGTVLPLNDSDQLPTAFFVNRMKELYTKMEKAQGKMETLCEMCSEANAVAFCRQCTDFICNDCAKLHKKLKVFAGHKVVTLQELKEGGSKAIPLKEAPLTMCKGHDEQLKIYCFDCNHLICRDCMHHLRPCRTQVRICEEIRPSVQEDSQREFGATCKDPNQHLSCYQGGGEG